MSSGANVKDKTKAAFFHFVISAIVFAISIAIMWLAWYPPPYFFADGGWQITRLAASVDLVLGPLLTFAVFKKGKRGLAFDLTLIGILQMSVLIYGGVLMYQQRPAFVVFGDGQFQTVTHSQVSGMGKSDAALAELAKGGGLPPMVYISLPTEPKAAQDFIFDVMRKYRQTYYAVAALYEPMTPKNRQAVLAHSHDLAKRTKNDAQAQKKLQAFLNKYGGTEKDYAFIPLVCRYERLFLGLRKANGSVAGGLHIVPSGALAEPLS